MNLFKKYNVQSIVGLETGITDEMNEAIDLWTRIASNEAPWNCKFPSCGVPAQIAGALADPVDEELKVTSENERLNEAMKALDSKSSELVQNMALLGGSIVRPVYSSGKMQFEIIKLGNYIPTSYDFDGTLTGALVLKHFNEGNKAFLLIEKHNFKDRTHHVKLQLYKVFNTTLFACSLLECTQTQDLTEEYQYENVDKPFLVEFKLRRPNNIDGSQYPCAIYSGYETLLADADRQFDIIKWEQIGGEMKVMADSDLFKPYQTKKNGVTTVKLSDELQKLFIRVNGNGTDSEKVYTHAPGLRTDSQISAFNEILRRIELTCNIGKGTLSDLAEVTQTATQYTGGKKALYSMIDSVESELEDKYRHCAYIFAYMLSAYEGIPFNDNIEITWNDAGRKDPQAMKTQAMTEVINGIMSKAEYRMMFYGEDEATANERIPQSESLEVNPFGQFGA